MTAPDGWTAGRALRSRGVGSLSAALGVSAALALGGCGGGGSGGAASFKPFSYGYLTPLRLNVGQIRIEDAAPPSGPDDLAPSAPVPPDQALRQMAQDRLVAAGNAGTAVFTVDQASVTGQPGSALDGTLAVHLDIIGNSGGHSGYAEAHVSRQFVPGSGGNGDDGGPRAQLYALTDKMMQDMNVEFEYQLRRTLGDWLLDASGAPLAGSVQQQPLTPSDGAASTSLPAPSPASIGAPVQLAPPTTPMPSDAVPVPPAPSYGVPSPPAGGAPEAVSPDAAPQPLSPPPGFLQAPPGAQPVPGLGPLPPPVPFQPGGGTGY